MKTTKIGLCKMCRSDLSVLSVMDERICDVCKKSGREVVVWTLKCNDNCVDLYLSGEKDISVRYQDERCLKPGDVIGLETTQSETFAITQVEDETKIQVKDSIDVFSTVGNNTQFDSVDEVVSFLQRWYNDNLTRETWIKVIYFDPILPIHRS